MELWAGFSFKNTHWIYENLQNCAALFLRSFQEGWKKNYFLINLANRWFGGTGRKKKLGIWSQCKDFSCIEHALSVDLWARLSPFFNVSKAFVCEGSFRSVFLLINCHYPPPLINNTSVRYSFSAMKKENIINYSCCHPPDSSCNCSKAWVLFHCVPT